MKTLHTIYNNFAKHNMAKFLTVLIILFTVGIGQILGATTYNFSSIPTTGWSKSGSTVTINSKKWTYSSSTYIGCSDKEKIQVGSSKNPQTSNWTIQIPISSFGTNIKVTKVAITAYTTATTATYDISVGGASVKNGSLTTSSATYSSNTLDATTGNIVVTLKGSSNSKAMYLSNISVTYETAASYTVNWTIAPATGGTLSSTSGNSTTVTPNVAYTYGSPAYEVTSGSASVSKSGNTFTATPTANSTIQINMVEKQKHTITWMSNGVQYGEKQIVVDGQAIGILPNTPPACSSKYSTFVGWYTLSSGTETTPSKSPQGVKVTESTIPDDDATYYAVWADGSGTGGENKRVTLDFSTNSWNLPNGNSNKVSSTTEKSYTSGDYTIKLAGDGSNGFYYNSNQLLLGKNGAYIKLPAFSFKVSKIVSVKPSGTVSGKVTWNIFSESTEVSTTLTGCTEECTFAINENYQDIGTIYTIKVTNANNLQIKKLEIYESVSGATGYITTCTTQTSVTLNPNGGEIANSDWTLENGVYKLTTEDGSIALPTITRTGYTFGGWATSAGGSKVYDDGATITLDGTAVNLYAIWTPITYTITYELDGGTNHASNPTNYTIETLDIKLQDPSKTGYTFGGWYKESTFATQVTQIAKGSTGTITLYAKWIVNTHTLTWNVNGGDALTGTYTSGTVEYGATITPPDFPTRNGYDFTYWHDGTNIVNEPATTMPDHDLTYTAQWETVVYGISYQGLEGASNNANNPDTYTIESETITFLPPGERTGYNFTGWNPASIAKGTTGNQTVTAQWTEKALTRYRTNCDACIPLDGFASINGTYHFFPDETITLTVTPPADAVPYTYQWQKLVGSYWTDITGATTTTYTKDETTIADAGRYRCVVSSEGYCDEIAEYNVKCLQLYVYYDNKSDVFNAPLNKANATTATISVDLQNANYKYYFKITDGCGNWYGFNGDIHSGWCTDVEMNADAYCGLKTTKFGTYVFNVNYSDLTKLTVSVLYPSAYQAADKVIYLDNNVLNWTNGKIYYRIGRSDHNSKTAMTKVPGTANLYKVTTGEYNNFDVWHLANNGCWSGDNSVYKTNTGDGWAATQATAFETLPVTSDVLTVTPTDLRSVGGEENNNNCEFYDYDITEGMKTWNAKIEEPSHGTITVKYTHHDGTAVNNFTSGDRDLAHTCLLTITATPNVGYSLASLTVNDEPFTSGNVHTLTADAVIKATFTINTHTVTWKLNGGNISGDESDIVQTYQYGAAIEAPDKPTYDCHEFVEWNSAYTVGMTMPDEDLVFTAKWNKLSYTITFKNYDGTVLQTSTVECGETPSYTGATPTREQTAMFEYEFADWTPTVAEATGDQTYTATYNQTKRQYTVTWFVDGKQIDSKSVAAGDLATAPEVNPIPCGAVLAGWTDAENGVYVHSTSTLYEGAQPSIEITDNKTFYAVFADYED